MDLTLSLLPVNGTRGEMLISCKPDGVYMNVYHENKELEFTIDKQEWYRYREFIESLLFVDKKSELEEFFNGFKL